jgi:enoyl-CoA hydratase/carnithine racemase
MREELETVVVSFDEERGVGTITLNRPDKLNAMNGQMRDDIVTAFETFADVDADADAGVAVRAVVMEGAGEKAFSAGADITGFSDASPSSFAGRGHGYCLGGGLETAFACDFRIASDRSTFGLPEVNLGLLPGGGGVQYVARLANPSAAMELAMTGDRISAEEARDLGIVNDVHPAEAFDDEVDAFVDRLAGQPPLAVRAIKDAARSAVQMNLQEGRRYDRQLFATLLETEDHQEGARAFADDDYDPEFVGR